MPVTYYHADSDDRTFSNYHTDDNTNYHANNHTNSWSHSVRPGQPDVVLR